MSATVDKQALEKLRHELRHEPWERGPAIEARLEKVKGKADQYLKSIGYGNKRDYKKIIVDGYPTVTTWARNAHIAKISWLANKGYIPTTEAY